MWEDKNYQPCLTRGENNEDYLNFNYKLLLLSSSSFALLLGVGSVKKTNINKFHLHTNIVKQTNIGLTTN
jgi:hypothetical protein